MTAQPAAAAPTSGCGPLASNPLFRPRNNNTNNSTTSSPLDLWRILLGNCYYCELYDASSSTVVNKPHFGFGSQHSKAMQFVELQGIRYIGLGSMADELTPRERVYDTLEQLTDRPERLLNIGYMVTQPNNNNTTDKTNQTTRQSTTTRATSNPPTTTTTTTQTIPLDVWNTNVSPQDTNPLDRQVQQLVNLIMTKDYANAKIFLRTQLTQLKKKWNQGHNRYLAGITAHNLAVVHTLAVLQDDHADDAEEKHSDHQDDPVDLFRQAIQIKELAFGSCHFEVAYSYDELGIQLYAHNQFEMALQAFSQAQTIRLQWHEQQQQSVPHGGGDTSKTLSLTKTTAIPLSSSTASHQPIPLTGQGVDMVLNNIACCKFQLKHYKAALQTLQEALMVQQQQQQQQQQQEQPPSKEHLTASRSQEAPAPVLSSSLSSSSSSGLDHSPKIPQDLDLLHRAILMCNCGYLHLCLKSYEDARSILEEALLIQQSVLLDEGHRAICDTRSNLELTNAFHL